MDYTIFAFIGCSWFGFAIGVLVTSSGRRSVEKTLAEQIAAEHDRYSDILALYRDTEDECRQIREQLVDRASPTPDASDTPQPDAKDDEAIVFDDEHRRAVYRGRKEDQKARVNQHLYMRG